MDLRCSMLPCCPMMFLLVEPKLSRMEQFHTAQVFAVLEAMNIPPTTRSFLIINPFPQ